MANKRTLTYRCADNYCGLLVYNTTITWRTAFEERWVWSASMTRKSYNGVQMDRRTEIRMWWFLERMRHYDWEPLGAWLRHQLMYTIAGRVSLKSLTVGEAGSINISGEYQRILKNAYGSAPASLYDDPLPGGGSPWLYAHRDTCHDKLQTVKDPRTPTTRWYSLHLPPSTPREALI